LERWREEEHADDGAENGDENGDDEVTQNAD
jgi:hypothetical protein